MLHFAKCGTEEQKASVTDWRDPAESELKYKIYAKTKKAETASTMQK